MFAGDRCRSDRGRGGGRRQAPGGSTCVRPTCNLSRDVTATVRNTLLPELPACVSVCDLTRQTSVETRTTRDDAVVQLTNVTTARACVRPPAPPRATPRMRAPRTGCSGGRPMRRTAALLLPTDAAGFARRGLQSMTLTMARCAANSHSKDDA